jgi:alpha-L-arabinofuranosidase
MFGVFWDEGIDSAQFFDLQGASRGHFHLSYQHGKELVVNPTGEVFRLYGRYFRGDRLRVKVDSPTYLYQWRDKDDGFELPVPLVIAQAANNREEGKLVVIMANRHRDGAAPAQVMLHNWRASVRTATRVTVTAQEPDLTETIIITGEDMLLPGSEGSIVALQLPPHSVTALLISGSVQP